MSVSQSQPQGRDGRPGEMITTSPPSRDSSTAPNSQTSTGVIRVDQTVTVEELPQQDNPSNNPAVFGDASQFYQATISATSQFARNLFSTTTLHNSNPDVSATPARNKRWIAIALLLALINLVSTVVDTMLSVMLPAIMIDLDIEGFQWALAGPSIGAAATVLTAGQLYGLYPFKRTYAIFSLLTLIGIVSPGFAPNMIFIFYARILLGIGIAGQQLGAMIFLDHDGTFTDKARRDFFFSVSSGIGLVIGPFFGGAFAQRDKFWKWSFYSTFALMALLLATLVYALPNQLHLPTPGTDSSHPDNWRSRFARLDLLGCVLSFVGILKLLITSNLAGTWVSWSNNYIYVPFAIGGFTILMLIIQQAYNLCTQPSLRVFPVEYLRHFKTTILFGLTFLVSGILNTTIPYAVLYQMLTRPGPSAVQTALYLMFSLTAPHFVPTLLVPVYIGSGLVTSYPILPSYTIWSMVTSTFLIVGAALLFVNSPDFFPGQEGIPLLARRFSLACIGWWSAVTLPLAHQIIDLLQSRSSQNRSLQHPYHNRCFILLASYLGSAIALTSTGSIFMHLGPRWTLQLLQDQLKDPFIHNAVLNPTKEDALISLLGYAFIRSGTSSESFVANLGAIRNAFSWSFVVILGFAVLAFILSVVMLMHKIWKGYFDWGSGVAAGVPEEWRVNQAPSQQEGLETETSRVHTMELVERGTAQSAAVGDVERRGRPLTR